MGLAERWRGFWFAETRPTRLALFRVIVYALALADLIAVFHTAFLDAHAVGQGGEGGEGPPAKAWKPIYVFELLGLGPIDLATAELVYAVALVALGAGLVGLFTRVAAPLAALSSMYWMGLG